MTQPLSNRDRRDNDGEHSDRQVYNPSNPLALTYSAFIPRVDRRDRVLLQCLVANIS